MATLTAAQTQFIETGSTMATIAYGTGAPPSEFIPLVNSAHPEITSINSTSGFSAQTYINTATSQIFIAIAGTNDFKDVIHGWTSP